MSELRLNKLQIRILKFLAKHKAAGITNVMHTKISEKFIDANLEISLIGLKNDLLIFRSHDYPSPSYTYEITKLGEKEIS